MRHVKGFFVRRKSKLIADLEPAEEQVYTYSPEKQLTAKLYSVSDDKYLITIVVKFPSRDSEVELQYDTGNRRLVKNPLERLVERLRSGEENPEYLFKLAEHYLQPSSV